ncbi:LOW QUALITY PROTEIN: hypothetical protein PHMEG_0008170 [Phytophthora megakarya]|uniref:Uncharacterized protein n=1 Tax=Phytophthora megakarya TaxID=4795 RepID=A0A225WJD5_9STRA|nr:LOW QUALITY PROTEIN: hypothetical protein PHMEG_0008170 [Phytophthora megakarya]
MYLKIDYICVYQDTSSNTDTAIGCDPSSHPKKTWIEDNIDDYTNTDNPYTAVSGKPSATRTTTALDHTDSVVTGTCSSSERCGVFVGLVDRSSIHGSRQHHSWTGPRCTEVASTSDDDTLFGPPLFVSIAAAIVTVAVAVILIKRRQVKQVKQLNLKNRAKEHATDRAEDLYKTASMMAPDHSSTTSDKAAVLLSGDAGSKKEDYTTNLV